MLEGFEKIKLASEQPYILISKSGLTFNKDAIAALNCATWVDVLRKPETKELAVVVTAEPDENSFAFYNSEKKNSNVVRWTNRKLIRMIERDMNWNTNTSSYRVEGCLIEENVLLFKLEEAIELL